MRDMWRLSGIAVVFLVLLRMAIGWQFTYEGLWKLGTLATAKPWTSAGYLRNARGPFRETYRALSGDPDDLRWLDYDAVSARLDEYRDAFLAKHPDLADEQKTRLAQLLDGQAKSSTRLGVLPAGVKLEGAIGKIVSFDAKGKQLVVDGKKHLLPKEYADLQKMATSAKDAAKADVDAFLKALERVYRQASRLCYRERLALLLKIDPERVGQVYRDEMTKEVVEKRQGKISRYKDMLARYNERSSQADVDFERRHLALEWDEIQKLRAELVNPVRALESDFKDEARKLLNVDQLARGAASGPATPQERIDRLTIWSLIVLGGLLMVGLLSRPAAIAAAGLLLTFYLAVPPWPGVEELVETAGPEHSLIVNKNLIEVIALLAVASLPTGQWFGLDRLVWGLLGRNRSRQQPASPAASPEKPATMPVA